MTDEGKDLRRRDFVRLAGISLGAFAISDVLTRAFSIGGGKALYACCEPGADEPPPPPGCDPTVDPPPCCDPGCQNCEGACQPCDVDNPCGDCEPPCEGNDNPCNDNPCNDPCCDPGCEPNDAGCAWCDNEGCPRCETGDVCVFECCDPPGGANDV